jgi:stage II sporulation protein D
VATDEYVAGVVAGELAIGAIDTGAVEAMLAVQAILARTYATANVGRHAREGFDLCSTTHCQVYRAPEQVLPANRPLALAASSATSGQVLVFEGRPAIALYHSSCGGQTSAPDRIWGGDVRPYLRPVTDEACRLDPSAAWSFTLTRASAREALNATARTAVGTRLDAISIVERDEAGRAALVALDGERSPLVRGEELRAAIVSRLGARTLRSPRFDVRRDGDRFVFTGRGRGHGAGLCQHGALARLQAGANVATVLATYFPGTTLTPASSRLTGRSPADRYARR